MKKGNPAASNTGFPCFPPVMQRPVGLLYAKASTMEFRVALGRIAVDAFSGSGS